MITAASTQPLPLSSGNPWYASASVGLPVLDISRKWNHAEVVLLTLASFTQQTFSRFIHLIVRESVLHPLLWLNYILL